MLPPDVWPVVLLHAHPPASRSACAAALAALAGRPLPVHSGRGQSRQPAQSLAEQQQRRRHLGRGLVQHVVHVVDAQLGHLDKQIRS